MMADVDFFSQNRFFQRSIKTMEKADFLYREVQSRLLNRLQGMNLVHGQAVELSVMQARHYLNMEIANTALSSVSTVVNVQELHSFSSAVCGLLYSNLFMSVHDLSEFFLSGLRVLRPGGLLLFSLLGPGSFKELADAFAHDNSPHLHRFYDMHDVGDLLLSSGYESPVMESSCIQITYGSLDSLFRDLRWMGAQCASQYRRRTLTGKGVWDVMRKNYKVDENGRYPLTIDLTLGHAWKPVGLVQSQSEKEVRVSMDNLKVRGKSG